MLQHKMIPKYCILQKCVLLKFPFKSDACYYTYLHILLEKAWYYFCNPAVDIQKFCMLTYTSSKKLGCIIFSVKVKC